MLSSVQQDSLKMRGTHKYTKKWTPQALESPKKSLKNPNAGYLFNKISLSHTTLVSTLMVLYNWAERLITDNFIEF